MDLIHVCCFVLCYALESELNNVRHGSFNYKPAGNLSQNSLSLSVFFLFSLSLPIFVLLTRLTLACGPLG